MNVLASLIEQKLSQELQDSNLSELRAVITHTIQSPEIAVPFVSESLQTEISELAQSFELRDQVSRALKEGEQTSSNSVPFPPTSKPAFTFIDLFAGIGGFRLALQHFGGKCVFSSEWDRNSKLTYENNFGETPFGDIRNVNESEIPDHDVLCAGFPCQPFSRAGVSARNALNTNHGFKCETQGTLFFDILRIVREKKPKVLFLENVRNLVSHDSGNTFETIKSELLDCGYSFQHELVDSSSLVPQRRIRCYIICIRDQELEFEFPTFEGPPLALSTVLDEQPDDKYTISDRLWEGHQNRTARNLKRGTGFTAFVADVSKPAKTLVARYGKDGKECLIPQQGKNPRMLTPRECARLQGFPEEFILPKAKTVAYKQFGNSVAVPIIMRIFESVMGQLPSLGSK